MLQPLVDRTHVHQPQERYDEDGPDKKANGRAERRAPYPGSASAGRPPYFHCSVLLPRERAT
jgi:hypothetical protein